MPTTTLLPSHTLRPDPWLQSPDATVEYHLRTEAEADVLCRLLGLFAQLQLLPQQLHASQQQQELHIHLVIQGLSPHRAGVLAQKLRGLVCVWAVDWQLLNHMQDTAVA